MGPKSIVFVRHAQSIGNTMTQDERAAHPTPNHAYPLTSVGVKQAAITAIYLRKNLSKDWPEIFFQSTFLRSQMTMEIIKTLPELPTPPVVLTDPRLDEKWDGIFHELTKREIRESYHDQVRMKKRSGYYHYRAPGGESCPDVELRIRSFLSDPLIAGKRILIVGHGRWAILFQKVLYGLTVEEFLKIKDEGLMEGGSENCSVTEYSINPILPPKCVVPWKGWLPEQNTEHA